MPHTLSQPVSARAPKRVPRALAAALMASTLLAGCAPAPVQAPGKPWHHLDDGTYRNPPGSPAARATLADMFAFFWRRLRDVPPAVPAGHVVPPAEALAAFTAHGDVDALTWLGHAAFLLRVGGVTVLTDPFLSDVAGPAGFGPERFVAPGLPLAALPPIDVILVSHNHYDHLDHDTVVALPGKAHVNVVVPLGLGAFFRERGYANVHERDWYERANVAGIEVEVLPAVHFSRRGLFDRNRTLWSGFAIRANGRSVYHSGDTAHSAVFTEVGERAGPFDLALVAIGAYEPRSIMRASHVTPEDAVRLADDVRAGVAVGMHWGTIRLTDEPAFEPPGRFLAAACRAGWRDGRARVMRIGETVPLSRLLPERD